MFTLKMKTVSYLSRVTVDGIVVYTVYLLDIFKEFYISAVQLASPPVSSDPTPLAGKVTESLSALIVTMLDGEWLGTIRYLQAWLIYECGGHR